MRILLAHNRYQNLGGEDTVFDSEASLLEQHGHTVIKFLEDNRRIVNMNPLLLATNTIWSEFSYKKLARVLMETKPDVAHFHNIFPLLSPSVYSACRENKVPVIQELQNYRLLCPVATLLRNDHICEDCLGKTPPWPGILHACYRNSRAQTTIVAAMITIHRWLQTWKNKVDLFITPSAFTRGKFIEAGFLPQKIIVCPNLFQPFSKEVKKKNQFVFFIGRLASEKGFAIALSAWQYLDGIPLKVVGDGPLLSEMQRWVQAQKLAQVEFLGWMDRQELAGCYAQARFLIYPSLYYETFGISISEAYSCGVPVIASRLGALAEIVEDGRTGLLFQAGDAKDLASKVQWAWNHPKEMEEMGREARRVYEIKFSEERHYSILMSAYETSIRLNAARTP
jgi:glycosyltransferase involved in cell wall biosynthesis